MDRRRDNHIGLLDMRQMMRESWGSMIEIHEEEHGTVDSEEEEDLKNREYPYIVALRFLKKR